MKYQLIDAARTAGLLPFLDRLSYVRRSLKAARRNRRFVRDHPDFEPPPGELAFDAYNNIDWQEYHDVGLRHAEAMAGMIRDRMEVGRGSTVLEWGCGPGRLIRHMPRLFPGARIVGTDYNLATIEWCKAKLNGIEFFENGLMPPLPFDDNTIDATYNFSVFTHLSAEAQASWAMELFRVLKPGGVMVGTTHGEAYRYLLVKEAQRRAFREGSVVLQENYDEGQKWYFSIHPPAYVRGQLFAHFSELELVDGEDAGIKQDIWIGRKAG